MGKLAAVAVLMLAGCALTTQSRQHGEYTGSSAPDCSTGKERALVDVAVTLATAAVAFTADINHSFGDSTDSVVVGSGAAAIAFGLSSMAGAVWADTCRDAHHKWDGMSDSERMAAAPQQRNGNGAIDPDAQPLSK